MALTGARPARSLPLGLGMPARGARRRTATRWAGYSAAGRRLAQATGISGLMLALAVAVSLAVFYLSQSSHVAAIGYEIDDLEVQLAEVTAERQLLILQISQARAPAVIEREAVKRLRLRPLEETRIRFATPSPERAD